MKRPYKEPKWLTEGDKQIEKEKLEKEMEEKRNKKRNKKNQGKQLQNKKNQGKQLQNKHLFETCPIIKSFVENWEMKIKDKLNRKTTTKQSIENNPKRAIIQILYFINGFQNFEEFLLSDLFESKMQLVFEEFDKKPANSTNLKHLFYIKKFFERIYSFHSKPAFSFKLEKMIEIIDNRIKK